MNFVLSEEQEMLKKSARDFFDKECPRLLVRQVEEDEKGYSPDLWKKMAHLDWMGLLIPEQYGGIGGSFLDLVVVLEEMGRACVPSPFISTVILGGMTILDMGTEVQKQDILPDIVYGNSILTMALLEPTCSYEASAINCEAIAEGDKYIISGIKLFVPDFFNSDKVICVARTNKDSMANTGITLFLLDSKSEGIECTPLKSIAGDKQFEISFNQVAVPKNNILGELEECWDEVERIIQLAAIAKCAEMIGGAQQVLEMTINYANERIAFDHPIGSYQAIQHFCANMATDVDGARFNTYNAAWLISEGLSDSRAVAIAKAFTNEAYQRVIASSHQIHGAIGLTKDHELELYTRRAKAAELAYGDADYHRNKIACELLKVGD